MANETIFTKGQFLDVLKGLRVPENLSRDFLYDAYVAAMEGSQELKKAYGALAAMPINSTQLVLYLVNEHSFYLMMHPDKKEADIVKDDKYVQLTISVALDKYFTNEHLAYKNGRFASRFLPEISTISIYLNFIQGMLSRYKRGDPKETLVVDIISKAFSMSECMVDLLTSGFETEAFSTWRTLHENECILAVIVKYGKPVIDEYLKHLTYALAFRGGLPSKEETDAVFIQIKGEMRSLGLKSKDMKRFIEYGWLIGAKDYASTEGFKFNFRDGVERMAGLSNYSKVYEMSSEIAHSSALLIYSRKNYFYLVSMINLYESFFRLEKIFSSIYLSTVPEAEQKQYLAMRQLYFGELMAVYAYEKKRLANLTSASKKKIEAAKS
ncbi:MAG: DUF5677 domain-containing protein [Bacilli bacterium]|jgi:hypothetical protein|nr:DUF5677 domain-containing protein [Bacilli bacterium]